MNIYWIIQKIKTENPLLLLRKMIYSKWSRWKRIRRLRGKTSGLEVYSPEFKYFSPHGAQQLWRGARDRTWTVQSATLWPLLYQRAANHAEAAAEGRFDLLGSDETNLLDDCGCIRWHDDFKAGHTFSGECLYLNVPIEVGYDGPDIKVPWELSRFQHVFNLIWVNDDSYSDLFLNQWSDWNKVNPVARGVNWACTMDVALRAISWSAALAAWGEQWDDSTKNEFLNSLAMHGHFIRDNLEWAVVARTNHYFTDLVGLAILGAVLKPYKPAWKWGRFAARELRREIIQQFAHDGFNKECSTTYHRLMLELAIIGYHVCHINNHDLGTFCRDRLISAFQAIDYLSDSSSCIPLIGDNDSGRVFPLGVRKDQDISHLASLGAVVLNAPQLAGPTASPELAFIMGNEGLTSYAIMKRPNIEKIFGKGLPNSGLFVLGEPQRHFVIRCGPLTYQRIGGHMHLDQLSITLSLFGKEFIVDPGQYCYTPWPLIRNHFRNTESHNTVMIDEQQQNKVFCPDRMSYSVINHARPKCLEWSANSKGARFAGQHQGYRRLRGGGDHIREIIFDSVSSLWIINDHFTLTGRHYYQWRLHLHPNVNIYNEDNYWILDRDGIYLKIDIESYKFSRRVEKGLYAQKYGQKESTQVLIWDLEADSPPECTFRINVLCSDGSSCGNISADIST